MWISEAFAANTATTTDNTVHLDALSEVPSAFEAFMTNAGLLLVLMVLFYVLLILPQQRRFKEHTKMLSDLKKGDKVITGGGLLGKIDKVLNDQEVIIDLGNDIKVTALRSTIQSKSDIFLKSSSSGAKAQVEKNDDVAINKNEPLKAKSKKKSI